jgi:tetratricopeptide (TPR) repeat protein
MLYKTITAHKKLLLMQVAVAALLLNPAPASAQKEEGMAEAPAVEQAAPSPSPEELETPDIYFDSGAAPGPSVTQSKAPKWVDPRKEPGQRFIVVEKNYSASAYESQVIAANRALKLGRYASALEMFEGLYKRNNRDPRVLMGLAVAQQQSGFTASAIQSYEEVLKRDPDNKEALINMMGLMKNQYPEVALRRLMEMRDRAPNHPGIAAQIGLIQAKLGHYDEAFKYLSIAASLDPKNASHIYNIAIIADRSGETAMAIEKYEEALKLDAMYGASRSIPRDTVYDRLYTLRRS